MSEYEGEIVVEKPKGIGDYVLEIVEQSKKLQAHNVRYVAALKKISVRHKKSSNPNKENCADNCPGCIAIEALKEVTDEKG